MFVKRIQLSLIHVAVAMTLVPINSTLNRVMIKELALSATLVAILASLPYIFSPLQVLIGSYADRHPVLGRRRTPYIVLGLLLCAAGVALAPQAVYLLPQHPALGLGLSLLVFMAWGMGFNLASVSYLSLASELSGEKGRSQTVSVMWFVMIVGIILTAAVLSRLLRNYSPTTLQHAFEAVALAALALGLLGLVGLEPRHLAASATDRPPARTGWAPLIRGVLGNHQARRFFLYLILLLAAILGQDVLLEPYGGEAFGLSVEATTRITSIWGGCVLVALLAAGLLERRVGKKRVAVWGAWGAIAGFLLIAGSGLAAWKDAFYLGVLLLGLGTGLATVANLSLMMDMTTREVGLFIGAWGVADALARLTGTLLAGVLRDVVGALSGLPLAGYVSVFAIQAVMLAVSLALLSRIDTGRFREEAQLSLAERAAALTDV
jgi:BCD family chlorophyll transporter-like MFS transporter